MKLNIVTHGGISRSGKVILGPIFSLFHEVSLPFNTPDLDWINSAYSKNHIDLASSSKLAALHISCYSWYAYLGRHTNHRKSDFTSFHNNKLPQLINENYAREDNDKSFIEYQKVVEQNKFIPVFTCDLSSELIQTLKTNYQIEVDEWYLRRDPIAIFNNWMSDDRINRRQSYSRMFNYKMFDNYQLNKLNPENLYDFIEKSFKEANLKKRQILFESIVTQPHEFINEIANKKGWNIDKSYYDKCIEFIRPRSIEEAFEPLDNLDKIPSAIIKKLHLLRDQYQNCM